MNIYEQLRRDEGVRLKPYTDTVGKLTIGVGRNLTDKGISEKEADAMLTADVMEVREGLSKNGYQYYLGDSDDDPAVVRYDVLVNMAFNMGIGGLLAFKKMLAAYKAGDWETAATEMLDSKWAEQVGPRAERLAKQMREGVWV